MHARWRVPPPRHCAVSRLWLAGRHAAACSHAADFLCTSQPLPLSFGGWYILIPAVETLPACASPAASGGAPRGRRPAAGERQTSQQALCWGRRCHLLLGNDTCSCCWGRAVSCQARREPEQARSGRCRVAGAHGPCTVPSPARSRVNTSCSPAAYFDKRASVTRQSAVFVKKVSIAAAEPRFFAALWTASLASNALNISGTLLFASGEAAEARHPSLFPRPCCSIAPTARLHDRRRRLNSRIALFICTGQAIWASASKRLTNYLARLPLAGHPPHRHPPHRHPCLLPLLLPPLRPLPLRPRRRPPLPLHHPLRRPPPLHPPLLPLPLLRRHRPALLPSLPEVPSFLEAPRPLLLWLPVASM